MVAGRFMLHPVYVRDQPEIEETFSDSFEACDALARFAEQHLPSDSTSETLVLNWTFARSSRTFKIVVKLCRLGYGQQASMLNRTLFEDMVCAHWAFRCPARANKLMTWHEQFVKLRRVAVYERYKIPHEMIPPDWDRTRKKRMRLLFRGGTWTGRSVPKVVKDIEGQWKEGDERERLNRMHDVIHQAHNGLLHHSSRSLSLGVGVDDSGKATFTLGPSTDLIALALGFAFWTYANTVSLTVAGENLTALNELASRYDGVVPDRSLRRLIADNDSRGPDSTA